MMKANEYAKTISVSDAKYYVEFDGIRLIVENGVIIGWYRP